MDVLFWVLAFLGGFVGGITGKAISPAFTRLLYRRREERFLRYARVRFPNAEAIEVISVGPTDKQAMENIERRLRDASRSL